MKSIDICPSQHIQRMFEGFLLYLLIVAPLHDSLRRVSALTIFYTFTLTALSRQNHSKKGAIVLR